MTRLHPTFRLLLQLGAALAVAGCTAPSMVLNAIGAATDTSASWAIVKHIHDKITEGGPVPCFRLNTVERALAAHCPPYTPGLIAQDDLRSPRLPMCPLAMAAREPRTWPVLAELIHKGAMPEACERAPLVELAQQHACPDFAAASPEARESLLWLAQADARSVHHDVVRMFSCPLAREVGFDAVLTRWIAEGALPAGQLGFNPLSALHPDMLATPLAKQLEAQGHRAGTALDPYDGRLRPGFEEAFRGGHYEALDWWFARRPELLDRVPPPQGDQLPWVPLAVALKPQELDTGVSQERLVSYLLARGANPQRRLPHRPDMTVERLARQMNSPLAPLLERAPSRGRVATRGAPNAP
ncbi:MAG: hypothetical protein JNJ42_04870 [Burkholderiaceae bacterium]|nr:hypothetical protein [Burkholderiaceae bacterium]